MLRFKDHLAVFFRSRERGEAPQKPFLHVSQISAKSDTANRSNNIISPHLVGDDGKEKHAAVHSTPVSLF